MKIPAKLIKTNSQITVSVLATLLYFFCSIFFEHTTIVENKWIPFIGALLFAILAQEVEWINLKSAFLISLLNGFIIFVSAFGISFIAPPAEKVAVKVITSGPNYFYSKNNLDSNMPLPQPTQVENTEVRRSFFRNWSR